MIDPPTSRTRPSGLYAALCFLVPFGGVLPVLLAGAPPADDDGGARFALGYWWCRSQAAGLRGEIWGARRRRA